VERTLLQAGWKLADPAHRLYRTEAETVAALRALA
jgi:SulP family sulfate permease